ncbi:MAG: glycosyltransferase family 4 protein [Wenzhouxiangella sp.]
MEHHARHHRGAGRVIDPLWLALLPVLALVVMLALLPPWRAWLMARQVVDEPGLRRSHNRVTPRGGGVVMALGLVIVALGMAWVDARLAGLLLFVIVMTALPGWLDDRASLPIRLRLLLQGVFALGLVLIQGLPATVSLGPLSLASPWLLGPLAGLAIIWMVNLHNFMDGADGLASQQAIVQGGLYALLFWRSGQTELAIVALGLVAVALAFLRVNRPPASLFMGDSGSLLIGGLVAWFALAALQSGAAGLLLCLLISCLFVVDSTLTLLRRLVKKRPWYTPHREHAYQVLLARGASHGPVLTMYTSINLGLVVPACVAAMLFPVWQGWIVAGVMMVLIALWFLVQRNHHGES